MVCGAQQNCSLVITPLFLGGNYACLRDAVIE